MDSQRDARTALEQYHLHGWQEVGKELGRGSYAAVVEVEYKGLRCAAKKIYPVLYEQGIGNLVSRFEEECRLLSQLRHPHVVQFLGIYFDPDSNLPVLVMELLPTTLAQCLDTYGVLPEEINYGILRDVSLGLRYLHQRPHPIVHRDLSANNVLLTSDMRAKISDLGVAKILGLSATQRSHMTQGPGTTPYMPPEALVPNPHYDVKVDIFSYGVMMVHILCGRWPFPGEAFCTNPDNPDDITPISEAGRRQEYLNNIPRDHPLMGLIHCCLRNRPAHRPDASYISEQVNEAASHTSLVFNNKVEMMERIWADAEQRERLQRDNETLTQERNAAITHQKVVTKQVEELCQQVQEQGQRIESDTREKDLLRERVDVLSQEKEVEVRQKVAQSLEVEDLQLQVADLAADLTRAHDTIAHKDKAYQKALTQKDQGHQQAMQQKDQAHQQAFRLNDRAHAQAVAGIQRAHQQAMALKDQSHESELQGRQTELTILRQELASMRDSASQNQQTICSLRDQLRRSRSHLASNQQVNLVTTPGAKLVWRECSEIPIAMFGAQAIVINGVVYVGGGRCESDAEFQCCTIYKYHPGDDKWATLPPSPVKWFGVGRVSGQLALVGGLVALTWKVTGNVHVFTNESQQWECSIPSMPTARCASSVVSYSSTLVVCGGSDQNDRILPCVELYDKGSSQWYQCPPLPSPHCWMSSAVIGDTLFLMGGFITGSVAKSFYSASISTSSLLDKAMWSTKGARSQQLWTTLKSLPYYWSTLASIGGCLLALGGRGKPDGGRIHASIHTYLPTSSTWYPIRELPLPLYRSTAVELPASNELLVIGGLNKWLPAKDCTQRQCGSVGFAPRIDHKCIVNVYS